jgi:hypothetical protein
MPHALQEACQREQGVLFQLFRWIELSETRTDGTMFRQMLGNPAMSCGIFRRHISGARVELKSTVTR